MPWHHLGAAPRQMCNSSKPLLFILVFYSFIRSKVTFLGSELSSQARGASPGSGIVGRRVLAYSAHSDLMPDRNTATRPFHPHFCFSPGQVTGWTADRLWLYLNCWITL